MKKNLRIVSAAAAALLAVAPVAASAVSVNAADSSAVTTTTNIGTVLPLTDGSTVNVKPNISLNTSAYEGVKANISVSFSATVDGTTATSNFTPNASTIELWKNEKDKVTQVTDLQQVTSSNAGATYQVKMTQVGLNFGSQNANKKVTLTFPEGDMFKTADTSLAQSHEVKLDQNGTITLPEVVMNVTAKDFANPAVVNWYNTATNAVVSTGNIELFAGSDAGKMNVAQVVSATEKKYHASNYGTKANQESSTISYTNNLKDALKAMNVDVDAQGWFVAPKSFTFNMTAKANNNDASSTLAVTVSVPNGKDMTVPSQSKTVMHNAFFYDKNGKRVGSDKVTRYNSATVAMNTTTINGKAYYEVIENGKATGKFINAANIDGTKRTLKHNAYVYKSSKKRANKVVLKKGTEVVTYGGAYTFKNGKQYYKIGNNTDKTYVKVSNF
ncbi:SLAP domain-containing protein [Lactobacillus crispatus]|uniref:SLAP domain-containing protein n=1 Tax=Lactobacillus crispatus TaxID=47770 RepID=UPI0028EA7FC8|nr:SLAP domain-containing protein [Lactobacillus crispatus]MDT9604252.1 SLAP domain-containing protein [Lactobacillus crispatus]